VCRPFLQAVVGTMLITTESAVRPLHYIPLHTAAIRSIDFVRLPSLNADLSGDLDCDAEATQIVSTGYEGTVFLTNLHDPLVPIILNHDRCEYSIALI
jgi:hypothetical protein